MALSNANLDITTGTTVLIGANGSGKSTFLSLLAGALSPDAGIVTVNDQQPHLASSSFRQTMGYAAQRPALDGEITGQESIDLFCTLNGITKNDANQWIKNLLSVFELKDHLSKQVRSYSGGMKQRLHLIMSALHQPDLWLLDEPTSALDPKAKNHFWSYIGSIKHDKCIVMAMHDLDEVESNADKVCILDNGSVVAYDTPSAIVNTYKSSRWTFKVKNDKGGQRLKTLLEEHHDVIRAESMLNKVTISIKNDDVSATDFQSLAHEKDIEIREVNKRSCDLSTAYFEITGRSPSRGHKNFQNKKNRT